MAKRQTDKETHKQNFKKLRRVIQRDTQTKLKKKFRRGIQKDTQTKKRKERGKKRKQLNNRRI